MLLVWVVGEGARASVRAAFGVGGVSAGHTGKRRQRNKQRAAVRSVNER